MHDWQPMHFSESTVRMFPLVLSTCRAPTGHTSRHAGSSHCLHCAMFMSSGKFSKGFCTTCIRARDKLSNPSCTSEQASIQLTQPWHFLVSTRRYPSAAGIDLPGMIQPANRTLITAIPEAFRKSLREIPEGRFTCSLSFRLFIIIYPLHPLRYCQKRTTENTEFSSVRSVVSYVLPC